MGFFLHQSQTSQKTFPRFVEYVDWSVYGFLPTNGLLKTLKEDGSLQQESMSTLWRTRLFRLLKIRKDWEILQLLGGDICEGSTMMLKI